MTSSNQFSARAFLVGSVLAASWLYGCSGQDDGAGASAFGGQVGLGGAVTGGASTASLGGAASLAGATASVTGGVAAQGGAGTLTAASTHVGGSTEVTSSGGTTAAGGTTSTGATSSTGGTKATGGTSNAGGTSSTGGTKAAGGTTSAGGTSAAGGSATTGGTTATGGTTSNGTPDCNSVTGEAVIQVASDGTGQYATVQAAINSLSTSNTTKTQIRIKPGTYKEKLVINRPNITLCGQAGKAKTTILTYSDNANTSNGNGGTLGTTGSSSTKISSNNVSAENITFANSTPLGGGQAVALWVSAKQVQFRNCRFLSYQDTLYVRTGTEYFKDCYIEGTVDFIFGDGTAVFDNCTVHNVSGGTAATAPNTAQTTAYGLVFLGGQLTAASSVAAGSVALGRNWGAYGAAAYIKTALGGHIKPVGWEAMGTNTLATARFSEYQTTGTGASAANLAKRASQSKQLTAAEAAAYTLPNIFGSWTPTFSK